MALFIVVEEMGLDFANEHALLLLETAGEGARKRQIEEGEKLLIVGKREG